jgi:hypothetical protein
VTRTLHFKLAKSSKVSLRTHMQVLQPSTFLQLRFQLAHLCPYRDECLTQREDNLGRSSY